jgi:hypothetical protein
MLECATGRRVAYVRLEDPPGLSPITTVGGFDTVEEAQVATERYGRRGGPTPIRQFSIKSYPGLQDSSAAGFVGATDHERTPMRGAVL